METTQYPQKMETSAGATEPTTPASPDQDDNRGRRRDRDETEGDNTGDGADGGDVPGSSRKRRRSRKGLERKFECPHEGCGKSYSRAEHLYRHQLNRECLLVGAQLRTNTAQTTPSKSTTATFPSATGLLSGKTCAHDTRSDIQQGAHSCCERRPSCTT